MTCTRETWCALLGAVLLATAGCQVGTPLSTFPPAHGARGAEADIRLVGWEVNIQGELLAIQDSSLILVYTDAQRKTRVAMARLPTITDAKFPNVGGGSAIHDGRFSSAAERSRLVLVSRYPQGISPDLMALLLTDYGQPALVDLANAP